MSYTLGFPTIEKEEEKSAHEATSELHKLYSQILYRTTAKTIGTTAHLAKNDSKHGHSSRFSKPLSAAGMFRHSGLNTHVERDRVFDGSKDWMDKIN